VTIERKQAASRVVHVSMELPNETLQLKEDLEGSKNIARGAKILISKRPTLTSAITGCADDVADPGTWDRDFGKLELYSENKRELRGASMLANINGFG
jgi:hypothetical protein